MAAAIARAAQAVDMIAKAAKENLAGFAIGVLRAACDHATRQSMAWTAAQ